MNEELSRLERHEIAKLLASEWGNTIEEAKDLIDTHEVRIIREYCSDGPGWCGDMYIFIWGEAQFMTSIGFNGYTGWQVFFDGECKYRM